MALDEGTLDLQMDHEWTIRQGGMPGPVVSRTAPAPTPAGRTPAPRFRTAGDAQQDPGVVPGTRTLRL